MHRYVAFLRGVSPMNAKMADLKTCFESAGYTNVRTVLASGNVVFDSAAKSDRILASAIERAMDKHLERTFPTIVRRVDYLLGVLKADPYSDFRLPPKAKRVVTFLREKPKADLLLPIEFDGAQILVADGGEVFSAYVPSPRGPVFMALIEKTFGRNVTTRTWETVKRCASA